MATEIININSSELVRFTNKLEKMARYDLPLAVRGTLNEMAFEMKGTSGARGQIAIQAKREFDYERQKNLFRVMTGVNKARGFDISSMKSEAGITKKSGRDKLAEGLAQQQEGGEINSNITPTNESRVGKSRARKVRTANYLKRLVPVDLTRNKGRRFVIRAAQAYKNNRAIIFKSRDGGTFVSTITHMGKGNSGRLLKMRLLFQVNNGSVNLRKRRPFVNNAAKRVMTRLPQEFKNQAEIRVKRAWEKR